MLYTLSRNSTEIVQWLSGTTEHVSHQTLLVQKRGETLTPMNTRIGTITSVRSRNIRTGSRCIGISWHCDSSIPGLTCTTRCNAVLSEAEGDTPEVVGKVDVVMLEAKLTVRRVWSNTSTPEVSPRRTENWHLRWVQRSIREIDLACLESVELARLISKDL